MRCPSLVGTVRDLRRKIQTVLGERRRTKVNETEIETTQALEPAAARSQRPRRLDSTGVDVRAVARRLGHGRGGGAPSWTSRPPG